MSSDIGIKLGVEDERKFKRALADINQTFKILGSEMQLVTSQFGKNEKSVGSLTARNEALNKEIAAQKDQISTLRAALQNSADSFGENDKDYENLTEQTCVESAADYANTALVGGEGEGADRREVFVDARDLQEGDFPDGYLGALLFRGQSRLSELAPVYGFDAGVNPHGNLRYKTDFDLGNTVKVVAKPWGVAMSARITEIEETYDADGLSITVTFGKSELTLAQKMRSDMSDVKTSLLAPPQIISGDFDIPDGGVTTDKLGDSAVTSAKISDGAVGTAELGTSSVVSSKLADGMVTTVKLADSAATTAKIADNAITTAKSVGGTIYYASCSTAATDAEKTATTSTGFALKSGVAVLVYFSTQNTADSPSLNISGTGAKRIIDLSWGYTPGAAIPRIALFVYNGSYWIIISPFMFTNAILANAVTAAKIADSAISTTKIADNAVTLAKIAPAAVTSMSVQNGSGVTVSASNCIKSRGVCYIDVTINVTTALAAGSTLFTITDAAFTSYSQTGFNIIKSGAADMAGGTLATNMTVKNSGAALSTGYWKINFSYPSAT